MITSPEVLRALFVIDLAFAQGRLTFVQWDELFRFLGSPVLTVRQLSSYRQHWQRWPLGAL